MRDLPTMSVACTPIRRKAKPMPALRLRSLGVGRAQVLRDGRPVGTIEVLSSRHAFPGQLGCDLVERGRRLRLYRGDLVGAFMEVAVRAD